MGSKPKVYEISKEIKSIEEMNMKLIDIVNQEFISSSAVTLQYKRAKSAFKKELKRLLPDCEVLIGSCAHFEISGFIVKTDKIVWFASGDLRCPMLGMLVRTAKHLKDYTGGSNNFVGYNEDFDQKFVEKIYQLLE